VREKIFAVVVLHPSFVFCIVNISLLELYSSLRCKREIVEARFLNYQIRLEKQNQARRRITIYFLCFIQVPNLACSLEYIVCPYFYMLAFCLSDSPANLTMKRPLC